MTFDPAALIPLGKAIAKIGLPFLPSLLNDVVPFPLSLLTGPAVTAILAVLGVDPTAPDAPAQAAAKIDADPTAAKAALQPVEDRHAQLAATAEAEFEAQIADAQSARNVQLEYVKAGSKLEWASPILGGIIVVGFIGTTFAVILHAVDQSPMAIYLITTLGAAFIALVSFYWGSSAGSKTKDDTLANLAKQPQVIQGPGSHLSGGVTPAKRR